jgi:error-prone DNA polymerase
LFAATDERAGKLREEAIEPEVELVAMREGEEVVADYRSTGLSLRAHPVSFLRVDLEARKMVTCGDLLNLKDGRWINLAGIVLIRQKPGSAKGVMFITLEDETGVANLVVWPNLFEKHRQVVLGARMMGVRGQVQREGDVIHVVAQRLDDLSDLLNTVAGPDDGRLFPVGRADAVKHGSGPDHRDPAEKSMGRAPRDIFIPDLCLGSGIIPGQPTEGIKVKPRNFH